MQNHHNVADHYYMWICVCLLSHRHQTLISRGHLQTDLESDLQTLKVHDLTIITLQEYTLQLFHFCIDSGNSEPISAILISASP